MLGSALIVCSLMTVMRRLNDYGLESRGRLTRQILWQESVIGNPIRRKRGKKYSIRSCEKSHNCQTLFSWKTSTYQMTAENTSERKKDCLKSRRFLECVEDILDIAGESANQERHPAGPVCEQREGLADDVMVGGHLRHSDHGVIAFLILREVRRRVHRTATLDFHKGDFVLFRDWLTEFLESSPEGKRSQ